MRLAKGNCVSTMNVVIDVCLGLLWLDWDYIDIVQTFEKNPDFAHYSNVHRTTQNIAMFFDEKSKHYKGPITRPVNTKGIPVDSPLPQLIADAKLHSSGG